MSESTRDLRVCDASTSQPVASVTITALQHPIGDLLDRVVEGIEAELDETTYAIERAGSGGGE